MPLTYIMVNWLLKSEDALAWDRDMSTSEKKTLGVRMLAPA
jgi:hypothetical protein